MITPIEPVVVVVPVDPGIENAGLGGRYRHRPVLALEQLQLLDVELLEHQRAVVILLEGRPLVRLGRRMQSVDRFGRDGHRGVETEEQPSERGDDGAVVSPDKDQVASVTLDGSVLFPLRGVAAYPADQRADTAAVEDDPETTNAEAVDGQSASDYFHQIDFSVGELPLGLREYPERPQGNRHGDLPNLLCAFKADQEEVAHVVSQYNILAVPVVDATFKLVGIITVDDVIDVIRKEATEDFLQMAGAGKDREILLKSTFLE